MRRVITALVLTAATGVAHAEAGDNKLFKCMDANSFELNSQCMASTIDTNPAFLKAQAKMTQKASESSDYVMATMKFYPRENRIEIVAHKDALVSQSAQSKTHIAKR